MKDPELLVLNGDLVGKRFAVGRNGLRLGRSSTNDIHVPAELLSRNHCLFELSEDGCVRVTDLVSANGTTVNGEDVGAKSVLLSPGDIVEAGGIRLRLIQEEDGRAVPPPQPEAARRDPTGAAPAQKPVARPAAGGDGSPAAIDLGLGGRRSMRRMADTAAAVRRRSPLAVVLKLAFLGALCWAGWTMVKDPSVWNRMRDFFGRPPEKLAEALADERLVEMRYEKVDATSAAVFRYALNLDEDGTMKVELDDVPSENRHVAKSVKLGEKSLARLAEILADRDFASLDDEYSGPDPEPPSLKRGALTVVWSRHAKSVRCVNAATQPEAFQRVCANLETFSRNELGVWALGHSRAELVAMASESAEIGRVKWEDRESDYGNVAAAVKAYRDATYYLETVNPKPPEFESYRKVLAEAEAELERRYREQRFRADRAINLGDWEAARNDLRILCEIVPDREDDRHREAEAKLVDVEKRLQKGVK